MTRPASTDAGFPTPVSTPASTPSTATSRRAAATRPAIYYDSPVTATKRTITYRELLDETATMAAVLQDLGVVGGRPGSDLHADDPGGDRRHARLRADRRRAFGGVWRLRRQGAGDPHRRRRAEGGADLELRRRARPHRRIQAPARTRDRPLQGTTAGGRRPSAAADRRAPSIPSATTTGRPSSRPPKPRASAPLAPISRRLTRSTSSTPRARPACRKASCATSAAISSRSNGRCRRSTTSTPARPSGPPPTSAGSSAIPTSSTRRCCTAARPCSMRASRSARPTPAPSGG